MAQSLPKTYHDASDGLVAIENIIAEVRSGRPFVLVDDDSDETAGHIVIPAEFATSIVVNFMARYGRGLICLAMDREATHRLGLKPMANEGKTSSREAFTVSIEARSGVTTGISAFDRARTIAVAANPQSRAEDIVTPGHVFPIIVRDGGVLVRSGHAEAAVDITRIAGLSPTAVICQILGRQGDLSRAAELKDFARDHQLKVGCVADLIAYRRLSETLVERVASAPFSSRYCGDATIHVYRNTIDGGEHVALTRGDIRPDTKTLVRVHQVDLTTDILGWSEGRQDYVPNALKAMANHEGPSVAVFIQDPCVTSISDRINGGRQDYMAAHATRDYGLGAQILLDIGVRDMTLLTSSRLKLTAIEGFGLRILDRQAV